MKTNKEKCHKCGYLDVVNGGKYRCTRMTRKCIYTPFSHLGWNQ